MKSLSCGNVAASRMRARWLEIVIACSVVALAVAGVFAVFGERESAPSRVSRAVDSGDSTRGSSSDSTDDLPPARAGDRAGRPPARGQDLW